MCMYFCAFNPDKGGDGGNSRGSAGAAGAEWSPSEVEGGLPCQVFGAGAAEEGGGSTERAGEGLFLLSLFSRLFYRHFRFQTEKTLTVSYEIKVKDWFTQTSQKPHILLSIGSFCFYKFLSLSELLPSLQSSQSE